MADFHVEGRNGVSEFVHRATQNGWKIVSVSYIQLHQDTTRQSHIFMQDILNTGTLLSGCMVSHQSFSGHK